MSLPSGHQQLLAEMGRQRGDALKTIARLRPQAGSHAALIADAGRLVLLGMGGSHWINRAAEPHYRACRIDATAHVLSEAMRAPLAGRSQLRIVTSQSGASGEIVRYLDEHPGLDRIIGMTLDPDSPLAKNSQALIGAGGVETAYAATRSLVVTLAMHVTAGGNISMRKEPVTSMAGLKGKKMRVPTPVVGRVLQQQGAVPVSGSLTELREMLSRGIIDGTVISDELVTGFKVDEDIHAVTQVPGGIFSNSAFIIMNKAKWEKISAEDQAAIMGISGEVLSEKMGALWHQNDVAAREIFKQRLGENYLVADASFMAEIDAAFAGELGKWKEMAAEMGIDADAALAFYNGEIERPSN